MRLTWKKAFQRSQSQQEPEISCLSETQPGRSGSAESSRRDALLSDRLALRVATVTVRVASLAHDCPFAGSSQTRVNLAMIKTRLDSQPSRFSSSLTAVRMWANLVTSMPICCITSLSRT